MTIEVYIEEHSAFGDDEPARRRIGEFTSRAEAVAAAQARVELILRELHKPGRTADELYQHWTLFGEDVYLLPGDGEPSFDAYEYAKRHSETIVKLS